jgi:hypothetical protein
MSSKTTSKWAGAKLFVRSAIFYMAIIAGFFSIIAIFTERNDREPAIGFLIASMIIIGFNFGSFVSRIFLRQKAKFQTQLFILLPIVSIVSLFFLAALSGPRNASGFKIVVQGWLAILFSFPLGLLVSLIYHKLKQQITVAETAAAHSKSELQLLHSQLSPHFLFNTLNNLYGISLREPDKTPGMLLKLSELLRYSVYDVKDPLVPLKDELNYLKNYIEFEKIRIGDRLDLKVDIEEFNMDKIRVAPMLLVVFVENAFKHAKNSLNDKIQIEISLKQWLNQVLFAVRNSHKDSGTEDTVNKHSGFGLQSTIKRLELLYPNAHDLKIEKDEDSFSIMLRVNIKRIK